MNQNPLRSKDQVQWLLVSAVSVSLLAGCGVNEFDRRYIDRLNKIAAGPAPAAGTTGGGQPGVPAVAPPVVPGTTTPTPSTPGTPATGTQELLGTWKVTSVTRKGAQDNALLEQSKMRLIFQGEEVTFSMAAGDAKHRFTVNVAKAPKWVDVVVVVNGTPTGQIMAGIFEITGNMGRIALLPPAAGTSDALPRPATYDTSPTDDIVVYALERQN